MQSALIFGVGSALIADYEESAARAGLEIIAAVRNFAGECFFSDPARVIDVSDVGAEHLAVPVLIPLFTPANRRHAAAQAEALGFGELATLIDPSAVLPRKLSHGPGFFVNAGCTLGAASSFGRAVLINRAAAVGHHAVIGDFCSIGPGAVIAGNVCIGQGSLIGSGAVVLPKTRIGENAVVGAGAVVTKDVPDGCLVLGNPARIVDGTPGQMGAL